MTELLELAQKLSGVSLATLLVAILYGSWKDWWCWSRDRDAMKQERDVIRAALEEDRNGWKRIALQHSGFVEQVVTRGSRGGSVGAGGGESA